MDPVTLATGAGIFLAGGILDRVVPKRRGKKMRCGCGHHFSYHAENGTGPCQFVSSMTENQCNCQQYMGP